MGSEIGKQIAKLLEGCIAHKSYKSGLLLHAHILRAGLSFDTFLFNRLIEFYSKCNHLRYARNVFDQMPSRDIFSWNAILTANCASDRLVEAQNLFDEMPERNVISWNNMISTFVKSDDALQALEYYHMMIREGLVPTHFTLASVFRACGAMQDVEYGKRCHGIALKVGIDKNMYVGNALLGMYTKCRHTGDAIKVFSKLQEPNEVSYTAMMSGLAETENCRDALEMFSLMHRTHVLIDAVSLSSVLGLCARGAAAAGDGGESGFSNQSSSIMCKVHGQLVHGLTIKMGFENDFHLSNSLLDMYAKTGSLASAEIIFNNLPKLSNISWNIMIAGYGQEYQIEKAIELLQRMEEYGFEPDEVTFINMLAGCVKSRDVIVARWVFDRMIMPSLSSWNAMLSVYFQTENQRKAVSLFREMQYRNIKPDRTTIAIVLGSCADMALLDCGRQVHAVAQKAAFHSDLYVGSGLITLYSKSGKIDVAKCIFDRLPLLDTACWNSMIAGLSSNLLEKQAFSFFNKMREADLSPTQFSYASLLCCCAMQSISSQGRQIHAQILKDGFINDVFVGSSLIGMYSKCGDVDGARHTFDSMPVRSTVTWNEMIHGYAQNGRGEEAVCVYGYMIRSGERPDHITMVAVLTACSHAGLVDEGIRIFESIKLDYEMEPFLDHYTAIIDCLGRAGRLHEAETIINKMPCQNDPVIWEVLLSSCRFHNDVLMAKRAAEKLSCLNPENHTPYVLLANLYSSTGRWDDAKVVRELMSYKHLSKGPAFSRVEYTNGQEEFESAESYAALSQ